MLNLEQQMEAIRTGRSIQFGAPVTVLGTTIAALIAGQFAYVRLPGLCSNLWIPPTIVKNGAIVAQPPNLVLGIQLNSQNAPVLPWGLLGNNIASFTGPVEQMWVSLLSGVGTIGDITFLTGRGIGVAYSGGLTAAGTPSASPAVGGAGNLS